MIGHLLVAEEHDVARVRSGSRECRRRRRTRPRRARRRSAARCARRRSSRGPPPTRARSRTCRASRLSARRTAFSRPSSCISRSTRCATISVSVSVLNVVPLRLQLVLQLEVVLDDAVVDDDDAAGAVAVRVRVLLGGPAVRGPAGVADAVDAVDRLDPDRVFEVRQLAGRAPQLDAFRARRAPRPPSRSRGIPCGAARRAARARQVSSRCIR